MLHLFDIWQVHEYEVGKNSLVFWRVQNNNNYYYCIYCACKITKLAILISQYSAATHLRCVGQCNTLLQIYCRIQQWIGPKIENRLIFARIMNRSTESLFLARNVYKVANLFVCLCLSYLSISDSGCSVSIIWRGSRGQERIVRGLTCLQYHGEETKVTYKTQNRDKTTHIYRSEQNLTLKVSCIPHLQLDSWIKIKN